MAVAGAEHAQGSVAAQVAGSLRTVADPTTVPGKAKYLQAAPGGYAEGDEFVGATVPQCRALARRYRREVNDADLVSLLGSRWHEERHTALFLVHEIFKRSDGPRQDEVVRLVLAHRQRIDNWDLVDAWAPAVLGPWLLRPDRAVERRELLEAMASADSVWDRRTAVVSTFAFIRGGDFADTLALGERLLGDPHHLVHKALGWMLREVGNRDVATLEGFLDQHGPRMPRVTLRYAIERLDPERRTLYLGRPRR